MMKARLDFKPEGKDIIKWRVIISLRIPVRNRVKGSRNSSVATGILPLLSPF